MIFTLIPTGRYGRKWVNEISLNDLEHIEAMFLICVKIGYCPLHELERIYSKLIKEKIEEYMYSNYKYFKGKLAYEKENKKATN